MGCVVEMLLWTWMILDSGVSSVSLPEITDVKFIDECVREHNRARSSVSPAASDMLHMTWDKNLAITARTWAGNCVFEHNPSLKDVRLHPDFSSVGENIWTGSPPSSFDVTRAMKSWVDEKRHYSYDSNVCSAICGHYTQVVWASSHKVGCAVQLCPNGISGFSSTEGSIFVCNYAPAGNVNGWRPYQREGRNRTSDRDPALAASDSDYLPVVVVRPIALLLTFITAYAVHHFYPDVFCYE
ncbi:glioma pathogenesis-related protein 1 [Antennarius striatus]|uniref:glioma pathogenesis-related protein 1 n=1 Tax=Antennarius striatus TaxID=241820 RepID=UPI0035B34282